MAFAPLPQTAPAWKPAFENVLGNLNATSGQDPFAGGGAQQSLGSLNSMIYGLKQKAQLDALTKQAGQSVGTGIANTIANYTPPPSTYAGGGNLVDRIAAAIREHESGGNYNALNGSEAANIAARGAYQFIPSTYASVNKMFGGDGSWSQANQDKVAKAYIASILSSNGNDPASVASTWYVGHPVARGSSEWNSVPYPSAGNTITVGSYADYLLNWLNSHK